jgi:tetratricopeptide (TPR) repeat protein
MKKAEKILLLLLLVLLIGRICGIPGMGAFFTLASLLLALAYLILGFRLLRTSEATPFWLAVSTGVALAASMAALPFAMYVRQDPVFKLLPVPNGVLLVVLLVRWAVAARRKSKFGTEHPLIIRSAVLFTVLAFLSYMPPNALYRSVIITLNRGHDQLIANMRMVEEFDAYESAFARGDCEAALHHAEAANHHGRIWLFGTDEAETRWKRSNGRLDLGQGFRFDPDSMVNMMKAQEQQQQLWKISRTYDDMYNAHHCLAENAGEASDVTMAYEHYHKADSVLNVIKGREGYWNEERAWSLSYLARSAAALGEYDLSDSLYKESLGVYTEVKDSLDPEAAQILADWSRSLSMRRAWPYANYLIRAAIGYTEADSANKIGDTRWIRYRLQLVKNLISTDSIPLAERILSPCEEATHTDSSLRCETLLVKGALQFRKNAFRSADTTFAEAVACLSTLQHNETAKAIAYLSWGHVKTALAEYGPARELVTQGQSAIAAARPNPSIEGGLLELSALIHHLQGHYQSARKEYEASLDLLASNSGSADQTPGAMAGLADVLIDLAETSLARALADSALAMVADPLPDILPGQASVLNTAAYADYCINDLERAQQRYAISLNACQRHVAMRTTTYVQALNGQALVAMALSRYATADSLLMQAHSTCLSIHGQEHPFTARVLINQAELRMKQRRFPEARTLLLSALPITERILGKDHDQLGDIHKALGEIDRRSANPAEASKHFEEALRIYKACFPAEHPKVRALEKL